MKSLFTLLATALLFFGTQALSAQTQVWTAIIDFNGNVDNVEVLAQIDANIPESGKVLVQFDGTCISSVGDLIVLAANDSPNWGVNSGNVGVEANPNQEEHSFSHSRVYAVNPGTSSFYAVAQRYVETSGDGSAYIAGMLSVKFFPDGSEMSLNSDIIEMTNVNLRDNPPVTLGQVSINPSMSGTAIVRFNGECTSDPGDLIVLAASDTPDSWDFFNNINIMAIDDDYKSWSFSHTRVYSIGAGSHTFYALGENYITTNGNGLASIYGTLTVEFIPDMYQSDVIPAFSNIFGSFDISVSEEIASVNINAPEDGTVIVTFDGLAEPNGIVILGASDENTLQSFGVAASPYDETLAQFPFSHSQAYSVTAGNHNFYATGEEFSGSPIVQLYGSLTATFVSNDVNVQTEEVEQLAKSIEVFPNPTADYAQVELGEVENISLLQLLDVEGKVLQRFDPKAASHNKQLSIDLRALPAGTYFLQILTENHISISKPLTRK